MEGGSPLLLLMSIYIEIKSPHLLTKVKLDKVLLIGRSLECDIVLNSHAVDLVHAKIFISQQNDKIYFQDLSLEYITRVNGKKVQSSGEFILGINDHIEIGSFSLKINLEELNFLEKFNLSRNHNQSVAMVNGK